MPSKLPFSVVAVLLAVALASVAATAQSYRSMRDEHVTIAAVRIALWSWLTPAERVRLDAIDTSFTRRGSARVLMLLCADRVARVVLPIALDGAHRPQDAARLRALPPVVDSASARHANSVVVSLLPLSASPPGTGIVTGPLGCDQPLTWGSIALQNASNPDFADRADAAMAFCAAARVGGDRAVLVDAAIALVRDLGAAARAPAGAAR